MRRASSASASDDVAFRDGYDPASGDRFTELYMYALRHFGPSAATVRLAGPKRGTKLLRTASGVRHLLRELAVYADWDTGGDCFPAEERLAEALAVGRDTVSGWVQDAQSTGWLKVDKPNPRDRHGRGWNVNRYTLVLPADIREQAEDHAKARRQSQYAQVAVEHDEPGDRQEARRQSRHAEGGESEVGSEDVGATGEHVGKTPRARRESTLEDVGTADTNPSEEPIKDPPKDLLNAWEDGESIGEVVVPADFDPADHGLADMRELFARMDARAHAFASRAAGFGAGPVVHLHASTDLDFLSARDFLELQYGMATNWEAS